MAPGSSEDTTSDYLVQARQPGVLAQVITFVRGNPAIRLVRALGPADDPHTLVLGMSDSQAADLMQRFPGQLVVEQDRPLTPFS